MGKQGKEGLEADQTQILREIYYEKMKGMGKFDKLWRRIQSQFSKKENPFSQKQVKTWLAKQRNVQETKQFKKRPALFTCTGVTMSMIGAGTT